MFRQQGLRVFLMPLHVWIILSIASWELSNHCVASWDVRQREERLYAAD